MINTLTFENGTKTGEAGTDGIKIPNPSSYSVTMIDIDLNSNRATSGLLDRNVVRRNVYSIACSWDWLNDEQLDKLLAACVTTSNDTPDFDLTFRNPLHKLDTGSLVTETGYTKKTVYVEGTRTANLIATADDGKDYWSVSLTFIDIGADTTHT